jgi:hypothetical protein
MEHQTVTARPEPLPAEYAILKLRVRNDLAISFAQCCKNSGVNANDEFVGFMKYRAYRQIDLPLPLCTVSRKDRRKAVACIITCLKKILAAEEAYVDNVPENFTGSENYDNALQCVDSIDEAISFLEDAY